MQATPGTRKVLKLYVSGTTARSEMPIRALEEICDEDLKGEFDFLVVDIIADPQAAEDGSALATPTIVREMPPPVRKVVGDFSKKEKNTHRAGSSGQGLNWVPAFCTER